MSSSIRGRVAALGGGVDRSIAILALLAFISQLGVAIMLPLLPLYAVQVGATPGQMGLMVGAFSVTSTLGQLSAGVLATWLSARRQMPLGQGIYALGNFLMATTATALPLIAFRAMSGFGGGLTLISERLYIARVTAQERLAFVNGVVSAAGSSGSVVGPLFGALLALHDLRVPFIVVGCTATVAAIAALAFLPAERRPDGGIDGPRPVDGRGVAGHEAASGEGIAGARAGTPPVLGRLERVGPLARLALWSVAFNAAYGGWITTFAPYSTQVLGLEASLVALFFVPFGLGAITLGPALARIADQRTGRRRMVALGTALVFVNVASLVAAAPVIVIYGTAILAGGGLTAAQASWFALLGVATDGGRRGRSFGLVSALSNLGVIAGAVVASQAWERFGLREGVLSSGVFLVLGAVSLLAVPDDRRR